MPDIKTLSFAILAFTAVTAAMVAWIVWQTLPERVHLADGGIVKAQRRNRETMALSEVECIRFHYHAVVGFISAWEFVSEVGRSLDVSGDARGIDQVISELERHLPGFSKAEFDRRFDLGDVEDTIEVWRRHA